MHVRYLLLCLANNILRVNKSYCYHFNCCMITIYIDCYLGHLFLLLMSILRLKDRKILFFFFSVFLGVMFSFQSILITGHVSPWERFWFRTWEPVKQLKYSEELLNEVWGRPQKLLFILVNWDTHLMLSMKTEDTHNLAIYSLLYTLEKCVHIWTKRCVQECS